VVIAMIFKRIDLQVKSIFKKDLSTTSVTAQSSGTDVALSFHSGGWT